jgi:hypothetical protein
MRYREIIKEDVQAVPDDQEQDSGFYNPDDDAINKHDLDDTRKPVLTLKMVNRLKKIRSTKNLEMAKKQELLGIMYGSAGAGDEEI